MVKSSSSPSGMDRGNGGKDKKVEKVAREDTEEKGRENSICEACKKLKVYFHPRYEQQRGTLWRSGEQVSDIR